MMNNKAVRKGLFPYVFLFVFIITCLFVFKMFDSKVNEFTYDEFIEKLKEDKQWQKTMKR